MAISIIEGGVTAPKDFMASGVWAGIRKNPDKKDLALIYSKKMATVAVMTTQNKAKAAPVKVTRLHALNNVAQAVICNSGNANACTPDGEEVALKMCSITADVLNLKPENVMVASTGVIGVPLDITKIENNSKNLAGALSENGSNDCAEAIMTTDTTKKEIAVSLTLSDGSTVKIGGISKGSGMIHPNMATMLGFITTDASISHNMLNTALNEIVNDTFNMISVDGDTSTNDMVIILANGSSGNKFIDEESTDYKEFYTALKMVCKHLAVAIAADGEGATKLLECTVTGTGDKQTAKILAKSVITSDLFKAAMFGADANWGRVLCALGNAPVNFNPLLTEVKFVSKAGEVTVCKNGVGVDFCEETAKAVLSEHKININISVGSGLCSATAWGCDLTYDYVKINGDYRS